MRDQFGSAWLNSIQSRSIAERLKRVPRVHCGEEPAAVGSCRSTRCAVEWPDPLGGADPDAVRGQVS